MKKIKLAGLQTLTLLDFPGRVACTVFTDGCNFKCPFCHNASLVNGENDLHLFEDEFFTFLRKRKGMLDGVAVTGGEPLIHSDIEDFLRKIRAEGYKIKLDTNGFFPEKLQRLINLKLVDYVAMDIKNSPDKYDLTSGKANTFDNVKKSIDLLLNGQLEYEFRTTAVKPLHEAEDFAEIGKIIKGANKYFIQCFKDSGDILNEGMSAPSPGELDSFLQAVKVYVPSATLRGV